MPIDTSSGGGRPIPIKPSKKPLYSLSHTINSLDNEFQCFDEDHRNRIDIYKSKTSEVFETIPR